jgi:hypothetical protein
VSKTSHTLDDAAVFAHELFLSYIRAGFNSDQAMQIVVALLSQNLATYNELHGGGEDAST